MRVSDNCLDCNDNKLHSPTPSLGRFFAISRLFSSYGFLKFDRSQLSRTRVILKSEKHQKIHMSHCQMHQQCNCRIKDEIRGVYVDDSCVDKRDTCYDNSTMCNFASLIFLHSNENSSWQL